ncbi:MAG: GNAT family N-acetyltransferase/peptidase C39 family protein [Akkermansiaceae bacterium]|nr:GNAT family N-acetyltransferase/peptidase C39 family protein [Akkermansiaceae bacterium]
MSKNFQIRPARAADLDALVVMEETCFATDQLTRRSFQRWLKGEHSIFLVAETDSGLAGYGLVLLHSGTRLARLYSIAILPEMRGRGIAKGLIIELEEAAQEQDRFFMRLEVAKANTDAIRLYEKLGYSVIGEWPNYYEDHSDALRMQKRIRFPDLVTSQARLPWYEQSTDFTCGPASMLMLMAAANPKQIVNRRLEIELWRESTTIYMTSGHGGCHPVGLALAAQARGYKATAYLSHRSTPFLEGVRAAHKKELIELVHQQFMDAAKTRRLPVKSGPVTCKRLAAWLNKGRLVMVLISSYRLNGDKAPHWVVVTAHDELCFYLHDPDVEKLTRSRMDCQDIPVAKQDFAKMLAYGSNRYSAAVVLERVG